MRIYDKTVGSEFKEFSADEYGLSSLLEELV